MDGKDWDVNTTNLMTMEYLDANASAGDTAAIMYSLTLVVPFTIIYGIIFVSGVLGNVSTCIVIARNKSMHTATNYYLFSLALSDMLLLISGLPPEMYKIWSPENYVFGETFCFLQGFAAEMSANATVLTITAFTVERYLAICHPFLSHTMSKLSRAIRYIIAIWLIALGLAVPQAIQFGIQYEIVNGRRNSYCQVVTTFFEHAFEISTFVFFVAPMTLITVLYILIGIQLRKSKNIAGAHRGSITHSDSRRGRLLRTTAAQNRVVKMLTAVFMNIKTDLREEEGDVPYNVADAAAAVVQDLLPTKSRAKYEKAYKTFKVAVVAAFFICWAPFHTQRLLAVYLSNASKEVQSQEILIKIYTILMYTSGLLYFLSTTINPVLYHIMSNKFRKAFQNTFTGMCSSRRRDSVRTYTAISRVPANCRNIQRSISDGVVPVNDKLISRKCSEHDVSTNHELNKIKIETLAESHSSSSGSAFSSTNADYELIRRSQNKNRNVPSDNRVDTNYFQLISKHVMLLFQTPNVTNKGSKTENGNNTNTISNSSLKDMDEVEFNSEDLVNYMNEINRDINK